MHANLVSRASILIADEERRLRQSWRQALNDARRLHFADNAAQALSCFQRKPVDLVFLGVLLPDMNGIELLKQLKQIDPHKPVIMATSVQDIQTAVDAMKAGAFDYLPAPFAGHRVRTLAARSLARRRPSGSGARSVHTSSTTRTARMRS